ncbi:hypothetical protein B0H11DRAFT_2261411 [Mycena galericulata]|nr:hypothetical protein B0H11DRAFT_2261411 [Mycena galericulata]
MQSPLPCQSARLSLGGGQQVARVSILLYKSKITLPVTTRGDTHIFGVPLEDLTGFNCDKSGIPHVVRDANQFIRESGMEEGLSDDAYDRGNVISLETSRDPHRAAVLQYLRGLPEPIIPESLFPTHDSLFPVVRRSPMPSPSGDDPASVERDIASVTYIRDVLLPQLPLCISILLSHVFLLMHPPRVEPHGRTQPRRGAVNLVTSMTSPAWDIWMCGVPGGPALFAQGMCRADDTINLPALELIEQEGPASPPPPLRSW